MKLAAGRYWLVLTPIATLQAFGVWVKSNPGRVSIERTEAGDLPEKNQDGAWVLFNTKQPITFDDASFGVPNAAGPEVQHAADTGHGKSPTAADRAAQALQDGIFAAINRALGNVPGLLLLGGLVYLASTEKKRR